MSWLITPQLKIDPDAAVYVDRVQTADGQALEAAVVTAIDTFVRGCKTDGVWNAIKASCILAGARTLNGALVPLVGAAPTSFNFVSGDYSRKTGLVGNGSTKYLNSNRPDNSDPQDNYHCSVYISDVPTVGNTYAGIGTTPQTTLLVGATRCRSNTATTYTTPTGNSFNGISRSASASYSARSNGLTVNLSIISESPSSITLTLYARNSSTVPNTYGNPRLAFYSIGESLDLALLDARVTTLITAFAAAIP